MRNEIPILEFSSHTPSFHDFGLYLNASRYHGGAKTTAVWLHGILVLNPDEDENVWLKSLNMSVISEANQLPQIAQVIIRRITVQDHLKDVLLAGDTKAQALPFSFNLTDVLGRGLYEDNFFVHVSARQYCSKPVRIVRDEAATGNYLERPERSEARFNEIDQLLKAYDAYSAKLFSEAVEYFSRALKSEAIGADIDRPNLFNAAYCAGQAALRAAPEVAKQMLEKTMQWRQEDLQLRNNLLVQIQKLIVLQNGNRNDQLEERRSQLLSDLGVVEAAP